eukprot:gene3810-4160_t
MSETVLLTETQAVRLQRAVLKQKARAPLRLPWFTDPRKMSRRQLYEAINSYGGDAASLASTSKAELVATVYELLVKRGKSFPLDPMNMDNEQPEKWYLLAEQLHRQFIEETPEPETRRMAMVEANAALRGQTIERLIKIADGSPSSIEIATGRETVLRFVSALKLEPHFEQAAGARTGRSGLIRASVTIAGNYNGYTHVPVHLTVEAARQQQNQTQDQQRGSRKRPAARALLVKDNATDAEVRLGEEICVSMGSERRVRARVTGIVESLVKPTAKSNDTIDIQQHVVAVPINVQDLGPQFTFSLPISDFLQAREDALAKRKSEMGREKVN